jgi:hypothetical protein
LGHNVCTLCQFIQYQKYIFGTGWFFGWLIFGISIVGLFDPDREKSCFKDEALMRHVYSHALTSIMLPASFDLRNLMTLALDKMTEALLTSTIMRTVGKVVGILVAN